MGDHSLLGMVDVTDSIHRAEPWATTLSWAWWMKPSLFTERNLGRPLSPGHGGCNRLYPPSRTLGDHSLLGVVDVTDSIHRADTFIDDISSMNGFTILLYVHITGWIFIYVNKNTNISVHWKCFRWLNWKMHVKQCYQYYPLTMAPPQKYRLVVLICVV